MLPLLGGLISGGGSLLSGIFNANTSAQNTQANIQAQQQQTNQTEAFNSVEAQIARNFSADQSQINRNFQDTESSTAYQRASKDMQAAGLNPAMMFGSAGAASTPSGAAGSGPAASIGVPNMALSNKTSPLANLGDAVSKAVNTAVSVKTIDKLTEEISNLQAEQGNIKARTGLTEQQTKSEYENTPRVAEQKKTQVEETGLRSAQRQAANYGLPQAQQSARQYQSLLDNMPDWVVGGVEATKYAGKPVADLVGSMISSARGAKGLAADAPSRRPSAKYPDKEFDPSYYKGENKPFFQGEAR